ncbi:hypothetical protein HDU96_006948 [Phlyctochytrium bullatum]|nr:hypothetical protein HDU96_006948 [Phlyctochytrium bullatum]
MHLVGLLSRGFGNVTRRAFSTLGKPESAELSTFLSRSGLDLPEDVLLKAVAYKSSRNPQSAFEGERYRILDHLYQKYPKLPSQALESCIESYSGRSTLSSVGRHLGVPYLAKMKNPREDNEVTAKIVSSLIGALYKEKGSKAAREFITSFILSRELDVSLHLKLSNPKGLLAKVLKDLGQPKPAARDALEKRFLEQVKVVDSPIDDLVEGGDKLMFVE